MGGQLAVEALRTTAMSGLGLRARVVLLAMAAHALDKPKADTPARVYWGGHRLLALEIYGPHQWDENTYARAGIKRAIRELLKAGLIRVYAQQSGGPTAYELLPRAGTHRDPTGGVL